MGDIFGHDIHCLIGCDNVSVNSESYSDTGGKIKAAKRIVCSAHRCDWSCGFRKQEGHGEHLYELREEGHQV